MAFNFNNLNKTLGQTNIFDPSSPVTQTGQAQQGMFRTSAPGLPGAAPGPSGGVPSLNPSAKSVQATYVAPNAKAQVYAGVQGTDTTKAIGGIQGNIQAAQAKLQAKANEYGAKTEAAKAQNALDPETVNKAVYGDDKAFRDTAARLSQTGAKTVDRFEGLKDEELPVGVDPLRDRYSYGEIFRNQAGANYTAGQSDYEDLLLGRNKGFSRIAQALGNQEDTLLKNNTDMADTETKKAQDILNADWTAQTDAIRGQLGDASKSVVDAAQARERQEEARRAGLNEYLIQHELIKGMRPGLEVFLKDSGYGDQLNLLDDTNAFNGLTDYINVNRDVNYKDLITEEEAKRFNRINGLLGNGEMMAAGAGTPADYDFDAQGGGDYITSILKGKAADQKTLNDLKAAEAAEADRVAKQKVYDETARKMAEDFRKFIEHEKEKQRQRQEAENDKVLR